MNQVLWSEELTKKFNPANPYEDGGKNIKREVTFTTLGFVMSTIFECVVLHLWSSESKYIVPFYSNFLGTSNGPVTLSFKYLLSRIGEMPTFTLFIVLCTNGTLKCAGLTLDMYYIKMCTHSIIKAKIQGLGLGFRCILLNMHCTIVARF